MANLSKNFRFYDMIDDDDKEAEYQNYRRTNTKKHKLNVYNRKRTK